MAWNNNYKKNLEKPADKFDEDGIRYIPIPKRDKNGNIYDYGFYSQVHSRIPFFWKKYPNWGDIYLAKALAFFGQDDIKKMKDALKIACSLNNQEACIDLQTMTGSHEKDLDSE